VQYTTRNRTDAIQFGVKVRKRGGTQGGRQTELTTTASFNYFQLGALACLLGLGIGRGAVLYARGVHVFAVDRQRTLVQGLADLLALVCLFWWYYETVAFSWRSTHAVHGVLGTVLLDSAVFKTAGALIMLVGLLIFALALWSFADSWRIGIDRDTPGALVTDGIFAWTRNPIYIALDLIFCGTFLLQGRAIFLVLAVALVLLLHYQVRREEAYLAAAYGEAYRQYCGRVGRYVRMKIAPTKMG
jgi:protein-S-isoprenylcysteine O-methyltransferase Ste14